jgi:hypothetical protein
MIADDIIQRKRIPLHDLRLEDLAREISMKISPDYDVPTIRRYLETSLHAYCDHRRCICLVDPDRDWGVPEELPPGTE